MQFKVNDKTYPMVENPTLGELRTLKRAFDLPEVDKLNPKDPDHIAGMLYLAMKRTDDGITVADVDAITNVEVVDDDGQPVAEEEVAADPPADAPAA